jgi:23S rRNA (adenine2503-C2)-methyltransferase
MQAIDPRANIIDFSRREIADWLAARKIAAYRASQIFQWVHLRQCDDFDEMTDLSKAIRQELAAHFRISRLQLEQVETSADGSRKSLYRLEDGAHIESVLIPEKDHYTLCISSQVGCAQGCQFCLTAHGGLERNLSRGEIIAQVRDALHDLRDDRATARGLTNIVFMGMGEPLDNYANLVGAIETLTDNDFGLRFASRRVTVSTAGLVPRLADLGRDTRVNLAVSLNATENQTRSRLMPINRRYPLEELLAACARYPLSPGRMITFEYILMEGINDSPADARRLARLLRPIRAKINLIPFNQNPFSRLRRPSPEAIAAFRELLCDAHYTALVRHSKGQDISAACGQLRAEGPGKK